MRWLDDRGYHGNDYVPHDIVATDWGTARTRIERLLMLGRRPLRIAKVAVGDGLQAGRIGINAAVFDDGEGARAARVRQGVEGLKAYRREWDDAMKTFRENPVKDWAEHIGSAWRYLGLAWQEVASEPSRKPFSSGYADAVQPPKHANPGTARATGIQNDTWTRHLGNRDVTRKQ